MTGDSENTTHTHGDFGDLLLLGLPYQQWLTLVNTNPIFMVNNGE
jgi:hypothetical protein